MIIKIRVMCWFNRNSHSLFFVFVRFGVATPKIGCVYIHNLNQPQQMLFKKASRRNKIDSMVPCFCFHAKKNEKHFSSLERNLFLSTISQYIRLHVS